MNPAGQDLAGPLSAALMPQHRLIAALGGLGAATAAGAACAGALEG